MDFLLRGAREEFLPSECLFGDQDFQKCPFLRSINEPTSFSFSSPVNLPRPVCGVKGPIFEDGPNFVTAFRLFHGCDGVVPLSGRFLESDPPLQFNPLAAKAATISLSAFGPGGPFSFGPLAEKFKKLKKKPITQGDPSSHEGMSNEWLDTGNCPIAKSYRAVNNFLPLVAKAIQPPAGMKFKCPPAIVAARAALARTALVRNLRPQPLPAKMMVIALMGMAANVPLGVWREHTVKFSLSWFVAVHAAVPFIAMLRKSVLMPKTAMAITIAASILGQVIGSRAERIRIKAAVAAQLGGQVATAGAEICSEIDDQSSSNVNKYLIRSGNCGGEGNRVKLVSLPLLKTAGA
ncbi:hypothetical protein MKW94_030404 [Papaver nudicaule]|uniref:Uncharacterized protein n=1 Tax=Papaver nudicaule TaxID=74823 RepID=A0AA41S4G7_PAPNU|nr:hypothetical protein [Papaver nudicaule]